MEQPVTASASQKPAAEVAAEAPPAPAPRAAVNPVVTAITPEKRGFKWYTPFGVTKDFVKGTVFGMGNGIARGAQLGLKYALIAAAVAFFLPLFPAVAAGVANALPWLTIGTNAAGVATFIPTGLEAIVAGLGWGAAGAIAGAAFAGGMGLLTGGAYELKLRGRREKYAEELAERAEMRSRQRTRGPRTNWRQHAQEAKQEQRDTLTRLNYFEDQNDAEQMLTNRAQPSSFWADKVDASRQNYDRSR